MNQILDYAPNNKSKKSGGSDKVVRVFAIILILFAIALIGVVVYGMIANKNEMNKESGQITYANIAVDLKEAQVTIKVTHDKNIQKLVYSWNESSERSIKGSEKYMEETIDVPAGDNTLHIKVIDENGVETTHDEEVSSEQGVDIINPIIELKVIDRKLQIKVTDETALDFMTYRWNEEEEETVYAEEGSKEIVTDIEILKGENDLTVVAVDASSNTTTETKAFIGLTKPEIKVTLSQDGSSIDIQATHENGIESVAYNLNNVNYNVDIGEGTPTNIQLPPQKLDVGYNRIIITVKSVDGTETTFDGECNYGDANSGSNSSAENTTNTSDTSNTTNETENSTSNEGEETSNE